MTDNTSMIATIAAVILAVGTPDVVHATDSPLPDKSVQIVEQRNSRSTVTLFAKVTGWTDATVTLWADLQNAISSSPMPVTVDSGGKQVFPVVVLRQVNLRQPWHYHYDYQWKGGGRTKMSAASLKKAESVVYSLPYTDDRFRVVQGWFGKVSHGKGSGDDYAIDWKMPVGTQVCAAREGKVVGIRQDSDVGGDDKKQFGHSANYVVIKHRDGTLAEYFHLKKDGVLVKLGDKVKRQQPLALSGNTGYSQGPHLHFMVFSIVDGKTRVPIPVQFRTTDGTVEELKEGHTY
jgi:murein DD-endopeptidase MepM/ murein hydrolase activator NlpD